MKRERDEERESERKRERNDREGEREKDIESERGRDMIERGKRERCNCLFGLSPNMS